MYKVIKKFTRGAETEVGRYKTIEEARAIIQTKLEEDAGLRIDAVYQIYEGFDDLIETLDQSHLKQPSEESSSSSKSGTGQRFSPSPLSTKPRVPGMPPSSWKDEEK